MSCIRLCFHLQRTPQLEGAHTPHPGNPALLFAALCRVRLQLARTLVLVARARAGAGAAGVATAGALTNDDLELLEGAVLAAEAALALFQTEGELA